MAAKKFQRKSAHDRKQDKQIKQLIKKIGKAEVKVFDDTNATAGGNLLTVISPLLPIAEGTGLKERVGQTVLLKHIAFKWYLNMNPNSTENPTSVRVCLVRDNQSDGAAPTYANVFPTDRVQSFENKTTMQHRFTVLYDKLVHFTLSATGVPNGQIGSGMFKKSYKTGKKVEFDGAAATDYHNGQVYLMCKSSELTNPPTIMWESRGLYNDY